MLQALRARFGERCSTAQAVREQHGRDESPYPVTPPEVVVFCESTDDVAAVRAGRRARGAGDPLRRGSARWKATCWRCRAASASTWPHDKHRAVHPEDLTATVQAGVTREQLNREIRDTGLFFPIDPGANASRSAAWRPRAPAAPTPCATAPCARTCWACTVVTASGEVIRTGTRAKKSSAGYDLTRLFVGSEGTLGVMTEVTLQAVPAARGGERGDLPVSRASTRRCAPPSSHPDGRAHRALRAAGRATPCARQQAFQAEPARAPMLLMEFHGSEAGVKEQAETVQELAREFGGEDFQWATTPEERTKLWTARHQAYFAALQTRPGCRCLSTDTCVPISRLAEMHQRIGGRGRGEAGCPTGSSAMWATATST
jgi:D-lactate dehydrogenase (cytochrome)